MRSLIRRFLRWLVRQSPFNGPVPDDDTQPLAPPAWPPVRKTIDMDEPE